MARSAHTNSNKSPEDLRLFCRFNNVAALMEALEKLGDKNPVAADPAYLELKKGGYVTIPNIVSVTPHDLVEEFDDADFSPQTIMARERKGYEETKKGAYESCGLAANLRARNKCYLLGVVDIETARA
jgi:hypothetical protein